MVRPRQVGPDLPSGVRRPDRAVSLGGSHISDPRVTSPDVHGEMIEIRGLSPQDFLDFDPESEEQAVVEGVAAGEVWALERATVVPVDELTPDEIADMRERARAELERRGAEEGVSEEGFIGELAPDMVDEARGLTADEAFRQHHAMAGGEPPREGRAHPERVPAPYEPAPPMSEKQKKLNRENIEKIRRGNPISQMAGPDWDAIEEGDYGAGNWWDAVPGMDDLDVFEDPYDPDLRSMDSQMLADMMVAQPEQGYFGGLGDAVQGLTNRVAGMSGQERAALIAALVAAGLITVGSGGTLAPAGAALLGGAGLTALNQ